MNGVAGNEHVLLCDGLRLRLVDTAAGGTPVLFQHGLCGSEEQVAEVLPYGHPRRRLTLECRGHGRSEAGDPSGFSIPGFAKDVAAAAASRGITSAVVGGISMGAAIALRLAVTQPDLVCGLVLARPAWITDPAPDCLVPNAVVGDLLSRHDSATALAMFEATPLRERLAREAPDNLASLRSFFSRAPRAVTAGLLTCISADGPGVTSAQVAALRVPTLIIGHERDAIHPLGHARALADMIPGAHLAEITPKAQDKARYIADFRAALDGFLDKIL
jgi:pimeloyl-ACP methyl ester carboxylesterase